MIQGDGFFVVKQRRRELYTRAGSFSLRRRRQPGQRRRRDRPGLDGRRNGDGQHQRRRSATSRCRSATSRPAGADQQRRRSAATCPSDAAVGTSPRRSIDVYDDQGNARSLAAYLRQDRRRRLDAERPARRHQRRGQVGTADLTCGRRPADLAPTPTATLNAARGAAGHTSAATCRSTSAPPRRPDPVRRPTPRHGRQDGAGWAPCSRSPSATTAARRRLLQRLKQTLGQIALALPNPPGLEKVGDSLYRGNVNSGLAPGRRGRHGGRGTLASGTLEMSQRRPGPGVHQPDRRPARLPGELPGHHRLATRSCRTWSTSSADHAAREPEPAGTAARLAAPAASAAGPGAVRSDLRSDGPTGRDLAAHLRGLTGRPASAEQPVRRPKGQAAPTDGRRTTRQGRTP